MLLLISPTHHHGPLSPSATGHVLPRHGTPDITATPCRARTPPASVCTWWLGVPLLAPSPWGQAIQSQNCGVRYMTHASQLGCSSTCCSDRTAATQAVVYSVSPHVCIPGHQRNAAMPTQYRPSDTIATCQPAGTRRQATTFHTLYPPPQVWQPDTPGCLLSWWRCADMLC
jgi:hypothetical protein